MISSRPSRLSVRFLMRRGPPRGGPLFRFSPPAASWDLRKFREILEFHENSVISWKLLVFSLFTRKRRPRRSRRSKPSITCRLGVVLEGRPAAKATFSQKTWFSVKCAEIPGNRENVEFCTFRDFPRFGVKGAPETSPGVTFIKGFPPRGRRCFHFTKMR